MATITFYTRIQQAKQIIIEIPDLELFKQKAKELVQEEGSLNFWNLDDDLSEYCSWKYGKEYYEEENDDMYPELDKLGVIWNDEQLLVESEN
jgi:hypothetical protein